VKLLIDSNAFLWWSETSPRLGTGARQAIVDPANEVVISIAALWEIIIKTSLRKLTLPDDVETMVLTQGFSTLAVGFDHLRRLSVLPQIHKDPFDRLMIAQALSEGMPVATADRRFAAYGVQIVW
jgi:PIN domain nuclease of toxin-antitoxin system